MAEWGSREKLMWAGVAERLKLMRHLLGISEQEAAAAMQMTLHTYRKWEAGERHRQHHRGIIDFCLSRKVELGWLFGGDKSGSPPQFKLRLVS